MNYKTDNYYIECIDGVEGIKKLDDKSIKLLYGSPPYPNAIRDYGVWTTDEYIDKIMPFFEAVKPKMKDDGFIVINVKANRERCTPKMSSKRSLVVERLAIAMEDKLDLHCVDIEIWVKSNPVPTGNRSSCQDAYEQNLWFSVSPQWEINLDAIRREYNDKTLKMYENNTYKPRKNGLKYVSKEKKIAPNENGALPINVVYGAVSCKSKQHQAVQPAYIPEKYIKATTSKGDTVLDPWMGSGTTGVVALELERQFIGFDIYQDYVELAKESLEKGK